MDRMESLICLVALFAGVDAVVTRVPTRAPTTATPTSAPFDTSCIHATSWFVNQNNAYSDIFDSFLDITTSTFVNATQNTTGWKTTFTGIPYYGHTFTSAEISKLNSRPDAADDFVTGQTTAVAGNFYNFGDNIGYETNKCYLGYWPPGPGCPANYSGTYTFPIFPSPEMRSSGCYVTAHNGYFVNGVPFWSWTDAQSYNDEDVWYNCAMSFEQYDLDVCWGHSASNTYHHHSVSPCLMSELNDIGDSHSPVHGFAYDGYPVYGPYQAEATLAVSCWQARDYDSEETGCVGGGRTCQFVDAYDYTEGTTHVSSPGPNPNGTTVTQSGNYINATSGVFFEDYFFNSSCSALGGQYLDSHNGHTHGSYGYHYHLTMDSSGTPTFPYTMGPKFYGCQPLTGSCMPTKVNGDKTSVCETTPTQAAGACTAFVSSPYAVPSDSVITPGPTLLPSASPITRSPTVKPTRKPSAVPTTRTPSAVPTTRTPSVSPSTASPTTLRPTSPTVSPTRRPSASPSAKTNSVSASDSSEQQVLSNGAIAGVAVGGAVVLVLFGLVLYHFCSQKIIDNPEVEMSALPTYEADPEEEARHAAEVRQKEFELGRDNSMLDAIGRANTKAFDFDDIYGGGTKF